MIANKSIDDLKNNGLKYDYDTLMTASINSITLFTRKLKEKRK